MSIQLKNIYKETKERYELEIIAGESGLDNIMYWLYITEDPENIQFIRRGELIITTGVLIRHNPDSLLTFVTNLKEKNACGLIVNTGKYIEKEQIPESVKEYCKRNGFPLLTMPWHIHIYDISRDYYNRIFYDTTKENTLSSALLDIIRDHSIPLSHASIFEQHDFNLNAEYRLAIISITRSDGSKFNIKTLPDYHYYMSILRAVFIRYNSNGHVFEDGLQLAVIAKDLSADTFLELISDIEQRLMAGPELINYNIGISDSIEGLANISCIYDHALLSLKYAVETKSKYTSYDDLGVIKLVHEIEDESILDDFVQSKLGRVLKYDELHNSSLTETLKSYLNNQGSISDISAECFCHRNTVTNRIEILTNELQYALKDSRERFELTFAFFLMDHSFMADS